jgi:glycosyltransferase involved in cell wall biosynthesis
MPYRKMNKKMLRGIGESDGVIYQSQFCKKAHEKFLGVKKKNAVIFNGADPKEFSPRNPQNFFLAVAKWRPHKRLKNICDAFLHARNLGLDADLVIVGEHGKRIKEKHVNDLGELNNKQLQRYLSEAIAMIHISWLDWCANSQIESIVAHCPLVYSDSGGSAEVGKNCGIAIKDVQWDFKTPVRLYKPPELSLDDIAHAMITLKHSSYVTESKSFHVKSIARQYIDFFKSLG